MKALKRIYIGLVLFFMYAPIVTLVFYSFNAGRNRSKFTGFGLIHYKELFEKREVMDALYNTLIIAIVSALVATIAGTITAIGMYAMRKRGKKFMMSLINIPIMNPDIVTGISLMLLYQAIRIIPSGMATLLLAHIAFNIPYVITTVLPKLGQMNPHLYEAAQDLGASPSYAFWHVIIPELLPGITSGFLLALTLSIDDFAVSFFTKGNGIETLSTLIYASTKQGVKLHINALSALMFVTILGLLLVVNLLTRPKKDSEKN